jgi:hypothetical protein
MKYKIYYSHVSIAEYCDETRQLNDHVQVICNGIIFTLFWNKIILNFVNSKIRVLGAAIISY